VTSLLERRKQAALMFFPDVERGKQRRGFWVT
jgi:hypothetical protein